MGEGRVPDEVIRLRFCERMGWTFSEYDDQPAVEILTALEIWRLDQLHKDH